MIETVGRVVDVGGVTIIVVGVMVASLTVLARLVRRDLNIYDFYRRRLGRSILLGLEFLG